jgi:signal transduction histidine kinase
MAGFTADEQASLPTTDRLLGYVADLELEVDRLRRQGRFIEKTTAATLTRILRLCTVTVPGDALSNLAEVKAAARQLAEVAKDLHDSPGYHPAHDQVVAIAVRPLIEQVFRWQQRLTGSGGVALKLELEIDHAEWFPVRLRHILDNLLANALQYRDPAATEPWVSVGLRAADGGYVLRVSDNGIGPPPGEDRRVLELFYRASPARMAGFGAGLAVVNLLVEQSGGTLLASPREGRGTDFVLTLPRYDLLDYLE